MNCDTETHTTSTRRKAIVDYALDKSYQLTIPWNKIIGMRHVLVHQYFEIDVDKVEEVINNEIPVLKKNILNTGLKCLMLIITAL